MKHCFLVKIETKVKKCIMEALYVTMQTIANKKKCNVLYVFLIDI